MVQDSKVELTLFHSGYCTASASMVDPEGGRGVSRFYAVWALIKHPVQGYLLFDTGYTKRFHTATKNFPERLYAMATPVVIEAGQSAREQLESSGINPSEIRSVILSHFHADHIGGVLDFPQAKFICSKKAMEEVLAKKGIGALRKGLLKSLLPSDLEARTNFIEELSNAITDPDSGLKFYDLFKDGSIKLVELPGHARGMLGILVSSEKGPVLFASDASWSKAAFLKQVLPSRRAKLFFDSWKEYKETFKDLLLYQEKNPEVMLLFTHCPQTMDYISQQHV